MKTLQHFNEFVKEITTSASRKHKQEVLTKYKDDEIVRQYLNIAYNPYIVFGVSEKKLAKSIPGMNPYPCDSIFELFNYLTIHNTGRDCDAKVCQATLEAVFSKDTECAYLLKELICKDLSIGCDTKTINSVMPNLIPQFSCMLAQKYFDKPAYVEGKEFAITTKLDGFRLIALKDKSGSIKFYSRVGQLVEGLVEIEAELKANFPDNIALDGELTISNYFDMPSKDAYKAASKIIRLKGDTPKTSLTYRIFDCMTATEFKTQTCNKTYQERRALLDTFAGLMDHVEVLPVIYQGTDTSKIIEVLNEITANGGEGCMINILSAPYVWNRTWNLLKVKKFNSLDLEVIDLEEGSGRLSNTLGAIKVRYKGGNIVKVGSGFSDDERALYWKQPNLILNKIVEVKFFEESTNADGTYSLRFPTWCSNIRDSRDKATPDF